MLFYQELSTIEVVTVEQAKTSAAMEEDKNDEAKNENTEKGEAKIE